MQKLHPVEEVGLAVLAPERLMRCIQSNPTEECQSNECKGQGRRNNNNK